VALSFEQWSPDDDPGKVVDVASPGGWDLLRADYSAQPSNPPLERVVEIAEAHGVRSVVVEKRYIDADWRSEHAHFYGSTFRRYPSVCHRLHFFAADIAPDFSNVEAQADAYRGYSIMRPLPGSPVGRTMIQPPPELHGAVVAVAPEKVNLFGFELSITSMPFISQDAQYLRCAHASIWMVLRHANLKHGLPRQLPSDVRDAATGGLVVGRQLPSDGLSPSQMLTALDTLGLPTGLLEAVPDSGPAVRPDPGTPTLYGVACRYINSDLPPIVVSDSHAWVVVAWARMPSAGHGALTLWRHDDARGPFMRVEDPWNEPEPQHQPWRFILTPLMSRMNLDAERAEATGAAWLKLAARVWSVSPDGSPGRTAAALAADELAFSTYAVSSSAYKVRLSRRGLDPALVQLYRTTQMPRYVWVVEAVDRKARRASQPNVLGEVILDATHATPDRLALTGVLCAHVEGTAISQGFDHGTVRQAAIASSGAYLSDRDAR
jgi:hypothetical protein